MANNTKEPMSAFVIVLLIFLALILIGAFINFIYKIEPYGQ